MAIFHHRRHMEYLCHSSYVILEHVVITKTFKLLMDSVEDFARKWAEREEVDTFRMGQSLLGHLNNLEFVN